MTLFSLQNVVLALICIQCTVGIILNGFIVATNINNWRRLKTLQTCDKILGCLATSRCLLLFLITLLKALFIFFHQLFLSPVFVSSMFVGILLLNHANLWFATILCVFYCVKITNYSHKFFIFLKTRISSLVHWFILASLSISVTSSLPCGWYVYRLDQQEYSSVLVENSTFTKVMIYPNTQIQFLMFLMGSLPSFLIFCVAILLLIHSLWVHIRHMSCNGTDFGSPRLEVHVRAVKSMSLFIMLQILYFVCMNIRVSPTYNVSSTWKTLINVIICIPPVLHSLYIIFSTKKLRETFLQGFGVFKVD
ncbi:taste receptor type 2 member 40-like [Leptodactylus fuscus]|uniref:taste receptor type 2 member 40-like n=1 Tax=Leptodactylus fuscus TaxID=238119 RepID=UPI003F4ED551